jgi:hypothetical protein
LATGYRVEHGLSARARGLVGEQVLTERVQRLRLEVVDVLRVREFKERQGDAGAGLAAGEGLLAQAGHALVVSARRPREDGLHQHGQIIEDAAVFVVRLP